MVMRKFLLCSLILSSLVASANEQQIIKAQYDAIEQGKAYLTPEYIDQLTQGYINGDQLLTDTRKEFNELNTKAAHQTNEIEYKVLVSDAMGDRQLRHLFRSLSHRADITFVVRGLLPEERTITDVGKRIVGLLRDFDKPPHVTLDPRPFQSVNASVAPQILMYQGGDLVLSASGLTNPTYIKEQFDLGKRGDLGNFGTVVNISERDITDVMKERMAKLDNKKIIQDAKDNYWNNVQFFALPKAAVSEQREFEPLVIIQENITTPDGTVVAYAGQEINTLEQLPFTMRLVVFDATDEEQVEQVKALPVSSLRTKYITTRYDRSLKWEAVKSIETKLGDAVYQLKPELITAFDLRVVPTVVTADNDRNIFIISELATGH